MSQLEMLVYISEVENEFFDSDALLNILKSAKKNNKELNVTGCLMCDYHYFIQALEGEPESVSKLYEFICKDKRHSNVKELSRETIQQRKFNDWEMGFVNPELAQNKKLQDLSVDEVLEIMEQHAN